MGHSNRLAELETLAVKASVVTNDPVEEHIIGVLQRLRYQNKRLKTQINKTMRWSNAKKTSTWQPFDFYNYFCSKFQERYGIEYKATGNIVLVYNMLNKFYLTKGISKDEYKQFIDLAFEKYFNKLNIPRVSAICNNKLYSHLMGDTTLQTADDFRSMDQEIISEAEKFEEKVSTWNNL